MDADVIVLSDNSDDDVTAVPAPVFRPAPNPATPNPPTSNPVPPNPATPNLATPNLATPSLATPNLATPNLITPNLATPNLATPNLATPNLATPNLVTPNLATPNLATPNLATPNLVTPNLVPPNPATPNVPQGAAQDATQHVGQPPYLPGELIAKTQPTEIPLQPIPADDDIQITSVTNTKSREGNSVAHEPSQPRKELVLVGERQGIRACRDYPHFRFLCDSYPFKKARPSKKEEYCSKCFCYICDVFASQCTKWSAHCKVNDAPKYRREREAVLKERRRRLMSKDDGRCTMRKRITVPQFVNDTQYELFVELPNDEEEFEDDGCPHSASEDDEQTPSPVGFDDGHVMQSLQRVRVDGKGSKLERVVDLNPEVLTYVTFHRGASAYEDLL